MKQNAPTTQVDYHDIQQLLEDKTCHRDDLKSAIHELVEENKALREYLSEFEDESQWYAELNAGYAKDRL